MGNNGFYSKQDYEEKLMELMEAVRPHYTKDRTGISLGVTGANYDDTTIGLEGFSRMLWGLVPLWTGDPRSDLLYAETIEGIRRGTDRSSPGYWGKYGDIHQAYVEMAAIALSLLLAPAKVWDALSQKEQENLNNWLLQINEHLLPENNWYFFRILVNCGLKKVGGRYSEASVTDAFILIESCYLGDGWYSDGRTLQRDYYISFAMHFYSLLYCKSMKAEDPDRCRIIEERARVFSHDFIYWFAEGGEALPYGRSLTYRFAQCAFWSAMAYAEVEEYSYGVMKGIISRHMRSWFEKPICSDNGILTIGYGYPNLNMAEGYNAPGSPYWALKSMLVLALPEEHPFWKAKEEALPDLEPVRMLPHGKMVITRPGKDNVIALASGQYPDFDPVHSAEKYAKFAYSTMFGFQVPRSYHNLAQAAPDNMLAFYKDELIRVRRRCLTSEIRENQVFSTWSPMEGVWVETTLCPSGNGHIRTHVIHADFDCEAYECGFALPVDSFVTYEKLVDEMQIRLAQGSYNSLMRLESGKGMPGYTACEPNTNLLHPKTMLPYLAIPVTKGITTVSVYVEAGLQG